MTYNHQEVINRLNEIVEEYFITYTQAIGLSDPADKAAIENFCSDFITNANAWRIVTENHFFDISNTIHEKENYTNFVFGLRAFTLIQFSEEEIKGLIRSFALANSSEKTKGSAYPEDSESWQVSFNDLVERYTANLWIIPLLALGLSFGKFKG